MEANKKKKIIDKTFIVYDVNCILNVFIICKGSYDFQ